MSCYAGFHIFGPLISFHSFISKSLTFDVGLGPSAPPWFHQWGGSLEFLAHDSHFEAIPCLFFFFPPVSPQPALRDGGER